MDKLKYFRRRQFALGPKYFDFPAWRRVEVAKNLLLTIHPDLPVTKVEEAGKSITVLGFMIDPYAQISSEENILKRMLDGVQNITDVIHQLETLTGRFVMIIEFKHGLFLFHDAVALRPVQYCRDNEGHTWCASQAETLAEVLGFSLDEETLDFRNLPVFQGKSEFWLPNDRTPYRQVLNLLPNHYLDLRRATAFRYWPTEGCIPQLTVEESINLCTPILVNSIIAASERFDLRMGVSAGIDSRKSLAATKHCSNKIYYFSHGVSEGSLEINDVTIPARLLPKLGLKHHALSLLPMSEEFRHLFQASSSWARENKGRIAFTMLTNFGPDSTVLNSNIGEVAQCVYWLPKSKIDGEGLASIYGFCHPFAISEFQKWLDGAIPACEAAGLNVLALFYQEQRIGRWATAAFSEYDIAHETFNPYNNRHLHCLMLGVEERHRRDRMWNVSLKQIKSMWPEVLEEPINPQDDWQAKVVQFIRRFIVHRTIAPWLPLYPWLRYRRKLRRFEKQKQRFNEERNTTSS